MGIFSRRSSRADDVPTEAASTATEPPAPPSLPEPRPVSSTEEASALLEEVGQIQRAIMDGASTAGAGEEIVSRLEGVVAYYLGAGADDVKVFDQLVAPASEWGLGRLYAPYLMDPDSAEGQAGKHAFDVVHAFREKYQHLNPDNT